MKSLKGVFDPSRRKYRNTAGRASIVSTISARLSIGDITEESLSEWKNLPREIRQDPSLDLFKRKNDLARSGKSNLNKLLCLQCYEKIVNDQVKRALQNGRTQSPKRMKNKLILKRTMWRKKHMTSKYDIFNENSFGCPLSPLG